MNRLVAVGGFFAAKSPHRNKSNALWHRDKRESLIKRIQSGQGVIEREWLLEKLGVTGDV